MTDFTRKDLKATCRSTYSAAPEGRGMSKHTGIKKLKNGRFRARYFAGYNKDGKRKYPARTFDTRSAAIEWRAAHVAGRGPGHADGFSLTVSEYVDQWLVGKQDLRENSKRMYRQTINAYIKPTLGRIKLARLTPDQIDAWQIALSEKVGRSTVASARTIMHGVCKKALRMKLIRFNPVEGTDGPGEAVVERQHFSVDEALAFIEASGSNRLGLLFEFALTCGLRPEELIAMRWQDLELGNARGVVRVRKVIHRIGKAWSWQEPKTKSSKRAIVFPAGLAQKLLEHRRLQLADQLKAGHHWQAHDLVFATRYGAPIKYSFLNVQFHKIASAAGLPQKVTPYALRHFFVTSSLLAGVDPKTVSDEAGHSKVSFTLDRYGTVLEEMHQTASDKREELLRSRRR